MNPITHTQKDHVQKNDDHEIPIFIDDTKYTLTNSDVSGAQLRALVPVPANRDLWLETHGPKDDTLIRPDHQYEIKQGAHFYTAPSTINPGAH